MAGAELAAAAGHRRAAVRVPITVQAQLPDVTNIQQNSRVRVGDVTVGNVTKIERQGWHALITMRLNGDVNLPPTPPPRSGRPACWASLHIELAPPTDVPPEGQLHDGSLIPLSRRLPTRPPSRLWRRYRCCSTAAGSDRSKTSRGVQHRVRRAGARPAQPDRADSTSSSATSTTRTDDIIAATEVSTIWSASSPSRNRSLDSALTDHSRRPGVLKDQRDNLAEALRPARQVQRAGRRLGQPDQGQPGRELEDLGPVLDSLANAGPALTRSLSSAGHLSVAQRDTRQLGPRRLRQPHRGHRPDAEPHRLGVLHRHPMGGRPDRTGDAVGPHHRPAAQPLHRGQPVGGPVPLRPRTVTCT